MRDPASLPLLTPELLLATGPFPAPRRRGEKISAVAFDCGFADVSYFNRVFRRRYGAAPSDVRTRTQRDPFGRRVH
jgi:AraC-like DNA-binding protein